MLPYVKTLFFIFLNLSLFSFANTPKVVIIGGGIAGLTTAYHLHKAGMDVDLYEARARVGGRILTGTIDGRVVELGGQNIADGGQAIHLNRLMDDFGLERVYSHVYVNFSYFNGIDVVPTPQISLDQKTDPDLLKQKLNQLASTHHNMKEILEQLVPPDSPLYKVLSVRMAAYEGGSIEKLSPLYTETLFHMLLGGISAVRQKEDIKEDIPVNLVTIAGGNSLLPQKISDELESKIHLNMPLIKVAENKNKGFQITFQNGTEIATDILVLAIPCSVYNQITFEENVIPSEKRAAIQNIPYGENAKILIPFTSIPSKNTAVVNDDVIGFFNPINRILTLYCTGSSSAFTPQTLAHSYMQARPLIKKGFENYPPYTIPSYAKDEANLSYEGPVGYSWPNDPYAKGSYSYIPPGQESLFTSTLKQKGETFKTLFAPINEKLYFVGEHTSILFDVPGTMEAACESGARIARSIIQNHKGIQNSQEENTVSLSN